MAAQVFGADAKKGKSNFDDNCSVCHNSDSEERKMGPGLKGLAKTDFPEPVLPNMPT